MPLCEKKDTCNQPKYVVLHQKQTTNRDEKQEINKNLRENGVKAVNIKIYSIKNKITSTFFEHQ